MLFTKNPSLRLLQCKTCHGSGFLNYKKCKECTGMSIGYSARGKFLYWKIPLNRYHIALRKARRTLDKFRIFGALVFTFGFLGLFALHIYLEKLTEVVTTYEYWFNIKDGDLYRILFWFAVISFSYLVYRIILSQKQHEMVDLKEYGERESDIKKLPNFKNWNEIKKISRKNKKDISGTFNKEAIFALERSYTFADSYDSEFITPIHIFYSLLSSPDILGVFIRLGIPVKRLQAHLSKLFVKSPEKRLPILSDDAQQIFFHAYENAYNARQEYVHVTELLVATVRQSEEIQELLYDLEVDKEKLQNVVEWVRIREKLRRQHSQFRRAASRRSKYGMDRAMTAVATPFLNSMSKDLTMSAKYGHLEPCVARDKEIEEIFRIIDSGRQSVMLVGDYGVGKMSIIEGITQRMIEDDVPKRLRDKRLIQISTSALLAGTTVSGAQERLIRIMNEVGHAKNIILFINSVQDLVGGSGGQSEGLDVSETLAEYLGPGKFLTFATTTTEGYNKHIVNSQVGTVFARVDIKEMEENQAIQVLESKAGGIEYRNNVFFSYDALAQSVKLAGHFMFDQNLPESAIEVMSESATYARNKKGANQLVTGEDVAVIVGNKTGIPTTSISEDESSKLLRLEEEMHKRVVGQKEAVKLVSNALRRARAEIRSTKRPIANFLFLGPTGVGKTELAKTIAGVYFGGEERMIRVDMSEYQDKTSIYRLIGQPGQQGTGILTEAVRQNPFSLVLLDEMEKADPNVLNLFLQVFDDGRLTDSVGRVIDFTNTIIIATSNAGTKYVQEQINKGVDLEKIRQTLIRGELQQYYRPEFLNRFDGVVLFRALVRDEIKQIARLMLKRVEKDLEQRGVGLEIDDIALEALAKVGFDPEFGARPMRRAIQEHVENKLAELIIGDKLKRRDVVMIGEGLEIKVK